MSAPPPIPPVDAPAPLTMREVLRVPIMRRLWIAQIVSTFGDFLALFAVIAFITYTLHGNPQDNTGLQIAYMLPIAVLVMLAVLIAVGKLFMEPEPVAPEAGATA